MGYAWHRMHYGKNKLDLEVEAEISLVGPDL